VLRKIFGAKKGVTGSLRKLRNEEVSSSVDTRRLMKSRETGWTGNVARLGRGKMHKFWWKRQKKKRKPIGKYSFDNNIKMDFTDIELSCMD
jgi:hypothetical protein